MIRSVDAYYKQTLPYKHGNISLEFKASQALFSSAVVDHGTQRLLRSLMFESVTSYKKALDLGCGYGPIGIALKATCPSAEVHLVDPDALALEYAKENAKLNEVGEMQVYASLGYDSVPDSDFDLIVSNIPAKVGEPAIHRILKDAQSHLVASGKVVVVVIDAIAEFVKQELESDENIEILFHRAWPGHHVYHYRFLSSEEPKSEEVANTEDFRGEMVLHVDGQFLELDTVHNLPEFDSISFDTDLLLDNLKYIKPQSRTILCTNPGQGYVPLALMQTFKPEQLSIIDRDLLALQTTRHNLEKNSMDPASFQTIHSAEFKVPATKLTAVVALLPEKLNVAVYQLFLEQIRDGMEQDGRVLLCSTSTVIARLEVLFSKMKGIEIRGRDKSRGFSVLMAERT